MPFHLLFLGLEKNSLNTALTAGPGMQSDGEGSWRAIPDASPEYEYMCSCAYSVVSDSATWLLYPPGSSVHGISQARILE